MRLFLSSLLLAAAATTASAQSCGTLTVTPGTGSLAITVHGDARSIALLAVGQTAGTTTINFGSLATLTLDLAMPFAPVPLGITNAAGDASRTIQVPASLPAADLVMQGLTATFAFTPPTSFGLSFCTSNTVAVHVGS